MSEGDPLVELARMRSSIEHTRRDLDEARRDIRELQDRIWRIDAAYLSRAINWALVLALLAISLAAVAAFSPAAAAPADATAPVAKDEARLEPVPVRIIDGDTFELAGEIIRLADIDTPEPNGACDAEKNLARLASARLASLLGGGRPWAIRRERTKAGEVRRDRYRRTLAILFTITPDGTPVTIGQILVSEGYAVLLEGRRHDWCGRGAR